MNKDVRSKPAPRMALVFPGCVDGIGGAESQALAFLAAYDHNALEAELVLLGANPTFVRRAHEVANLTVHELCPSCRHVWSPRMLWAYLRLVRGRGYRLVHLYGLRQEIMTRPWSRWLSGARIVSAIRGTEDQRGQWHRWLNRLTSRSVDLWIANSEYAREIAVARDGLPAARIAVVHNGVRCGERRDEPVDADGSFVIGCVANHFPEKRIEDLISSVATLAGAGIDARLVVAGRETEHTPRLRHLTAKLGLDERVSLLGYRSDVAALRKKFQVLALPSAKESFPSSLLEGMADGLPVVAAATSGVPEMVVNGTTGFLHEVGDLTMLLKHLRTLAEDPELRRRMGDAAMRRVESEFSMEILVANLTRHYRRLMELGGDGS